jgi:hypothetical protein
MGTDCGCGCGGTSAKPATFVRPRFFAGQLLTEDDLGLLIAYVTGKDRLRNRMLSGPGVVCGLEVACDPCGGGTVVVRPGYALDCGGNDIVVSCTERVDVNALVQELRVGSLGVDCGDPCDKDGRRHYGLYIRYEELSVEPVAPYATEEPCPSPGCVPSRIQEGFRFVVKCDESEDHRHNPGTRLLESLGDLGRFTDVRDRDQRLGLHAVPMFTAALGSGRVFQFDSSDAKRFADSLRWLRENGEGTPSVPVAREMAEYVRALASAVARYNTYDSAGQGQLRKDFSELDAVPEAQSALRTACDRLAGTDAEAAWPDPLHRSLVRAVVTETMARVAADASDPDAPAELHMLAQGTPLSHPLQVEFRGDLGLVREWLLGRLDRAAWLTDCSLRAAVASIDVPHLLPRQEPDSGEQVTTADLRQIAEAALKLTAVVRRFVTDSACSTLTPPCVDCADTDVLLAQLELDGCDVVRICSATREQVLPGGSAYGEWLPKLYRLRELAERVCCQPVPCYQAPTIPDDGPVTRPYVEGLLEDCPRTGELEQMLNLLLTPAPGETPPKALHEQVYQVPSEVEDSLQELAVLRARVTDLTAALDGVREQLGSAQERVTAVQDRVDELPERLGSRLEELERAEDEPADEPAKSSSSKAESSKAEAEKPAPSKPEAEKTGPENAEPAKPVRRTRSSRTQKPSSGGSS